MCAQSMCLCHLATVMTKYFTRGIVSNGGMYNKYINYSNTYTHTHKHKTWVSHMDYENYVTLPTVWSASE